VKVLVLGNSSAGIVKFRKKLIETLKEKGHTVVIATKLDVCVQELFDMECEIIEVEMDRRSINILGEFKLYRTYKKIIEHVKPDIIITYTIKPNIYCGMIARRKRIKYFCNITGLGTVFHSSKILKQIAVFLYKFALKKANMVFFENKENKIIFVQNNIVPEEKTFVLNGAGVDIEEYSYCPLQKSDQTNFLFIGRIMKEKGINELLSAMKNISEKNKKVKLFVVGSYEESYEEIIEQYQKSGVVEYFGWLDDVKPLIEKSHCVILPSYHEGMSNTLLEAAAMGRPLITSNISGCKETVIEGISGLLVEPKKIEDLEEKISQFLRLSFNEQEIMGMHGRKHMEESFDKNKIVGQTTDIMFGCS
jgi:galacturonosyltransferase